MKTMPAQPYPAAMTFRNLRCALFSAACAGIMLCAAAPSQAGEFKMSGFKITDFNISEHRNSASLGGDDRQPAKPAETPAENASGSSVRKPQNAPSKTQPAAVPAAKFSLPFLTAESLLPCSVCGNESSHRHSSASIFQNADTDGDGFSQPEAGAEERLPPKGE